MSISSSSFNLFEPWEIQPTKRRLCIGSDHLPYDYDIVPRHLISYLSAFPELRRKKTGGQILDDGLKKEAANVNGKDEYQMCLNVSKFQPNEISVKVKGEEIIIECIHEEREDKYGSMFRHFVKRIKLPEEYNSNNVSSSLSNDGILIVSAPRKVSSESKERIVQIQQTGPAYLNVKQNF